MRWEGCFAPAIVSAPCQSPPDAASPSATRPRALRRAPPSHHSTSGSERRSPSPSPLAPCARAALALLVAQSQAAKELRGAFERGIGIAAADERRDCRRLFRLGAAPAQAPQAAVDAATVAGRGEGGTQEEADAEGHSCPVQIIASLDVVCDAVCSVEHAQTQEEEAAHGPQPPQGGAGLYGAIAAAEQRGSEHAGQGEEQRGT
eukprot:scaffold113845_cov72-Phaeocystis_antarctica.AAC.2